LPGIDEEEGSLKDYASSKVSVIVFTGNHCPVAQSTKANVLEWYLDKLNSSDVGNDGEEKTLNIFRSRFTHLLFNRPARSVNKCIGILFVAASIVCAQTPQRPRIVGLSHYAVFAHDYEKSRSFYGGFLGFQEPYSLKNPDGSAIMTFFKVNDHQYIELYPEHEANSDRLSHISFETDDIEALRLYLKSKGVEVPDHAHKARIGNLGFNVTDPAGHQVEMVQYMPDGKTAGAYGKYVSDARISKHMTHVGVIVTKLDPEYKFYTEILGFKETWRGSSSGTVLSWVNLKVPDGDDYVEFMLMKDEPAPTLRGSAHHLCLQVGDVDASIATLKAKPYFSNYDRPLVVRTGINRKRQANIFDPDGTRTELMEPNTIDGRPTPASTAPPPQ
jgi:catechol 2,3-dioxygenase-like lactoylglutathione lyase family enzyme